MTCIEAACGKASRACSFERIDGFNDRLALSRELAQRMYGGEEWLVVPRGLRCANEGLLIESQVGDLAKGSSRRWPRGGFRRRSMTLL
jgi:hypothetical protein